MALFSLIQAFHDSGQALSGGKVVIDVSYFGWHVHSETHDLCGETACPISVGDFVLAHSQVLPGFTPPVSHCFVLSLKSLCAPACKAKMEYIYSCKCRFAVDPKSNLLYCQVLY